MQRPAVGLEDWVQLLRLRRVVRHDVRQQFGRVRAAQRRLCVMQPAHVLLGVEEMALWLFLLLMRDVDQHSLVLPELDLGPVVLLRVCAGALLPQVMPATPAPPTELRSQLASLGRAASAAAVSVGLDG